MALFLYASRLHACCVWFCVRFVYTEPVCWPGSTRTHTPNCVVLSLFMHAVWLKSTRCGMGEEQRLLESGREKPGGTCSSSRLCASMQQRHCHGQLRLYLYLCACPSPNVLVRVPCVLCVCVCCLLHISQSSQNSNFLFSSPASVVSFN